MTRGRLNCHTILVVCLGNLCRSPTAEILIKPLLPAIKIISAGISAIEGEEADERAIQVAEKYGLYLRGHRARQLTRKMCQQADLILVMEKRHIRHVSLFLPEARGKVMLLGHWNQKIDIPDPYGKSIDTFEKVFSLIQASIVSWKTILDIRG